MSKASIHRLAVAGHGAPFCVGRIVELCDGRPRVAFPGSDPRGVTARVCAPLEIRDGQDLSGVQVLLVADAGDGRGPIILGFLAEGFSPTTPAPSTDRLTFEASEEVALRCGEASLTLRADGQVVVKGSRLTSRASETNKIRGATVLIN